MGKIVSTALKVAAVAVNFIPGIGQLASAAITIGLSIGASLLAPKQKSPQNSPANQDRLRANVDPRTPRKTVVGYTAMATDIRDEEFTGNQEYFHRFMVVASHKVQSIDEIWFDNEMAWSASGGVISKFAGYLSVGIRTEGNAGEAINISSRMGATRRYTGLAYVYLRYKLTGNNKKAESPFAQSITTRITIRGRGAPFYDPRMDSTTDGGFGTHRADNQATWTWSDNACRNPALALLFYLLGWRINGELAVGKGIPANRIDLASFAVAANICDESVSTPAGAEPRYRCDGMWSEGDDPSAVIDMLKATMNADLDDVGGRLRLTVFTNDLGVADADFDQDDIIDDFDWNPATSLDDSFNIVRGLYTDASNQSLYQMVDYPEIGEVSPDGIDRIFPLNLPLVSSPYQAQRLANLRLERQKFAGTFRANFQATAWGVQKNSIIRLTFPPRGFVTKTFRVTDMDIQVDGIVPLTLREEAGTAYAPPPLVTPPDPAAVAIYDYTQNPIYLDVTEPKYEDGTIIDDLRPLELGATHGATAEQLANIAEAKAAADAAQDRADTLENETIPAINGSIDGARTEAAQALAAARADLEGEDTVLHQRINSLVVEGSGYDDSALWAEVGRVDTAAIGRDFAIGERIDTVEADYAGAIAAKAQEITTAFTDADTALAERATVLEASSGAANLVAKPQFKDGRAGGWQVENIGADTSFTENPGFPNFARFFNRDNLLYGSAAARRKDWSGRKLRIRAFMSAVESDGNQIGFGYFGYDNNGGVVERRIEQVSTTTQWFAIDYVLTVSAGVVAIDPWVWVNKTPGAPGRALLAFAEITDVTDVASLDARVSITETAVTDGRFATTSRVNMLESDYNGTKAAVTEQSGTIASLQGRTAAYWRTTAVAGNNRAQVTISADANGGAGVDIVGDLRVSGTALFDGTVVASKFLTNAGIDLAAVVPGSLNWRASLVSTTDYGPATSIDSGIINVGASGTASPSTIVTLAEIVQSGWAQGGRGVDANNDGVIEYYENWTSTLWFYYRINGGSWVDTGIRQTYTHSPFSGDFYTNSAPTTGGNKFSPHAGGTMEIGVRVTGNHAAGGYTGAIYDVIARFEVVNWK